MPQVPGVRPVDAESEARRIPVPAEVDSSLLPGRRSLRRRSLGFVSVLKAGECVELSARQIASICASDALRVGRVLVAHDSSLRFLEGPSVAEETGPLVVITDSDRAGAPERVASGRRGGAGGRSSS